MGRLAGEMESLDLHAAALVNKCKHECHSMFFKPFRFQELHAGFSRVVRPVCMYFTVLAAPMHGYLKYAALRKPKRYRKDIIVVSQGFSHKDLLRYTQQHILEDNGNNSPI